MMPANTIATVTSLGGAPITMLRTAALTAGPDFSATPTPSMATSTTPSGAKPVKLSTSPVKMRRTPSPFTRLTARIMPSSATPFEPAGRGSSTATPKYPNMPDSSTMPSASSANSVTGCGSRLPSHSTPSRKRVNALRFGRFAAGTVWSAAGGNSVMRDPVR